MSLEIERFVAPAVGVAFAALAALSAPWHGMIPVQSEIVRVDSSRCDELASFLAGHDIPPDVEDTAVPLVPRDRVADFYLALVAICHQTSPMGRPPLEGHVAGRRAVGWDYLSARFERACGEDPSWLSPRHWSTVQPTDLVTLFRDPAVGDRLHRPDRRAELLRDLGSKLIKSGWPSAGDLLAACQGRAVEGPGALLELLSRFEAYNDPVCKKSLFFTALMRNTGSWTPTDWHHVGPPVDYHEVRGHLRIGTVRVVSEALERKLRNRAAVSVDEDVAIRAAVYHAIMELSEKSGLRNPSQLHYLFWNVFRNVCTRSDPGCLSLRHRPNLPPRYGPLTTVHGEPRRCPFSGCCGSVAVETRYLEHSFDTDWY